MRQSVRKELLVAAENILTDRLAHDVPISACHAPDWNGGSIAQTIRDGSCWAPVSWLDLRLLKVLFQHEQFVMQLFECVSGIFMTRLLTRMHEKGARCLEMCEIVPQAGSGLAIIQHDPKMRGIAIQALQVGLHTSIHMSFAHFLCDADRLLDACQLLFDPAVFHIRLRFNFKLIKLQPASD